MPTGLTRLKNQDLRRIVALVREMHCDLSDVNHRGDAEIRDPPRLSGRAKRGRNDLWQGKCVLEVLQFNNYSAEPVSK